MRGHNERPTRTRATSQQELAAAPRIGHRRQSLADSNPLKEKKAQRPNQKEEELLLSRIRHGEPYHGSEESIQISNASFQNQHGKGLVLQAHLDRSAFVWCNSNSFLTAYATFGEFD
jgi:hypothetical protein